MTSKKRFSRKFATFEEWLSETRASRAYKERIHEAVLRHPGITLRQARGHAAARERKLEDIPRIPVSQLPVNSRTPEQERDLRTSREVYSEMVTSDTSLQQAALKRGIHPAKVRRTLAAFKKVDGRWMGKSFYVSPTEIRVLAEGKDHILNIPDSRNRRLVSQHHNAVKAFLESGDGNRLRSFIGKHVRDASGREWRLETNPEALYAILERREEEEYYDIYKE